MGADEITTVPANPRSDALRRLWASRGLLLTLVKRDIKVKYKESFLGFFWSFAKPLFLMAILGFVFGYLIEIKISNTRVAYPIHLIVSLVPWIFFLNGLNDSLFSLVNNGNLIKKVRVETEVFPLSAILSNGIHFLISMVVLIAAVWSYGIWKGYGLLFDYPIVLLPIAIGIQLILMIGIGLLISSLNVVFRDIASIFEVFMNALFYATPIIYDFTFFSSFIEDNPRWAWIKWIYILNPMVGITAAYRRALIYVGPLAADEGIEMTNGELFQLMLAALIVSVIVFAIGVWVFRRLRGTFADRL